MWDFSWLTDLGKGGSYENIEQRVAEVDNTLRIDCLPSHLLQKSTIFTKGYNPGEALTIPCWGR